MHTQYVYDNNDRLETAGGQTFTYDLNGNTKTVTEDANVTTSMYDQDNRLIAMQIVESGSLVEDITYEYDAGGIRTKKVVNGVETNFLVDQNRDYAQVLVEYTDLNQELAFYVFGDDLLSVTKFDAVGGSDKRWYQHDGMTSVRHLSDATGALTDSYTYAAYGTVLDESGAFENSYQFHGEARDPETGNIYLRARYYSPSIKRFTQMDSFQGFARDPLSLHKYAFTQGDGGINMIDPSGNFSLGSLMSGINIKGILATASAVDTGLSVLDFMMNPQKLKNMSPSQLGATILFGMGGGKLLRIFSKKISKLLPKNCKIDNSFERGTLVLTSEGLLPINDIEIGDLVYSYNEVTETDELKEVTNLIRKEKVYQRVTITVDSGETIVSTAEHPFYVDGIWLDAKTLKPGMTIKTMNGFAAVVNITSEEVSGITFNITVKDNHNYFVGSSRMLTHNAQKLCGSYLNHINGFIGEMRGYGWQLARGHVGIMSPGLPTAVGPDFITFDARGTGTIYVWDAKYKRSGKGIPKSIPATQRMAWTPVVKAKIAAMQGTKHYARINRAFMRGDISWEIFKWPPK